MRSCEQIITALGFVFVVSIILASLGAILSVFIPPGTWAFLDRLRRD